LFNAILFNLLLACRVNEAETIFIHLKTKFMARSTNNIAVHGLSGLVDQFVFRQRFGRTVVCKKPRAYGPPTNAQLGNRSRFSEAARYARAAISDPESKLFYRSKAKPGQSAYNIAFGDFFHAPEIGSIDTSSYDGSAGSRIMVPVTDDCKVVSVRLRIQAADGRVVEEGEAVLQADGLHWVYTAVMQNDVFPGSIVSVSASDLPGNSSVKQVVL
jgi:hypothetical protein